MQGINIFALAMGQNNEVACNFAEVGQSRFNRWRKEDPEFSAKCERAKTQPLFKAVSTLDKHLDDPKYATWLLERKLPKEYGLVTVKKVEGEVNVNHLLKELPDDELVKLAYGDKKV
ncbi:MAG: hypothetical protein WC364_13775, partial [Eubacteriales bacterium]